MPDIGAYRKQLRLSKEEAILYELLLAVGPSVAADIAVGMDIRVQAVYRLANGLAARKFVIIQPGWPRSFKAVPLVEAVEHMGRTDAVEQSTALAELLSDEP